jgi:hypothetical protein
MIRVLVVEDNVDFRRVLAPEEINRAYRRFGASFAVDPEGVLSLRLSLDLEEVGKSLQEKSIFWTAAIP